MEIIIHGKPEAGRHKATSLLDPAFTRKLVDEYFAASSQYNGTNCLLIELRNWRQANYSVYTYWMGQSVKDASNRPNSFFGITLVIPGKYALYTSSIQNLLVETIKRYVLGNYIDGSGRLLNMDSDEVFGRIVDYIQNNFRAELASLPAVSNQGLDTVCANPSDCDGQWFIDGLLKKGRGKVCPSTPSLDAAIKDIPALQAEIQNLKSLCQSKDNQIVQLQESLQQARSSGESNKKELLTKIERLQQKTASLESQLASGAATAEECNELRRRLGEIARLAGVNAAVNDGRQHGGNRTSGSFEHKGKKRGGYDDSYDGGRRPVQFDIKIIAIVATGLIALLVLVLLFKGCGSGKQIADTSQYIEQTVETDTKNADSPETDQSYSTAVGGAENNPVGAYDGTGGNAKAETYGDGMHAAEQGGLAAVESQPAVEYCTFTVSQDGKRLRSEDKYDISKPLIIEQAPGHKNCRLLFDNASVDVLPAGGGRLVKPIDSKKPVRIACTSAKTFDQVRKDEIFTLNCKGK